MAVQWPFNGRSMAIQWPFDGRSMAMPWPLHGHSMAIEWPFNGHSMAIQWPVKTVLKTQIADSKLLYAQPDMSICGVPAIARQETVSNQSRPKAPAMSATGPWKAHNDVCMRTTHCCYGDNAGDTSRTGHVP
eukprot:3308970-Lingulodinium_polyedra.AAC.2